MLYRFGLTADDVLTQTDDIFALKRVIHGCQLVADAAEPPNIGFEVVFLVFDDFRGKVEGSADSTVESAIGFYYLGDSQIS